MLDSNSGVAQVSSSRAKRKPGRASARRWFLLLLILVIFPLVYGCSSKEGAETKAAASREYIFGEVTDVRAGKTSGGKNGDLGTVLVEGSRSSPTDEALLTVTRKTRIVDRREGAGHQTVDFTSIKEGRTAEAYFQVLSSSPKPWRAVASEIYLDP